MVEKNEPQSSSEHYYSEMLLRQNPWLKDKLEGEEYPIAFSYGKPENPLGLSLIFIGSFVVIDMLLHLPAPGSVWFAIPAIFAGAALIYGGFWTIHFAKRAYILVTSKRVVYQKINLAGRPGRTISIPRSEIKRVRFLKSTVMYRVKRGDGGISISTKNGKTIFISSVLNGENVLGALRQL